MTRQNRFLPCYIQVNTGEEPQKSGVLPDQLEGFTHFCRERLAPHQWADVHTAC